MIIKCPNCSKVFDIPDERLPSDKRVSFPCTDCSEMVELDLRSNSNRDGENALSLSSDEKQGDRLTGEALKKKILSNVKDLPPMPQTVHKAREIMTNPKSDFEELATLFETDQSIATKILKMANSPYYGLSGKVTSIQRASVVLGHKTLGEIITLGGTSSLLAHRLEGYGLDAGALWKHSLAVAFGAQFIAKRKEPSLSNDAFTSGLIHDSGKLILDAYITERWDLFEAFMDDGQQTFLNAQKEILELDHGEVASEVCKKWGIPEPLTIAIRHHHCPSQADGNKLAYIIHAADAIAMVAGLGLGIDGTYYQMEDEAMEKLGLQEEDVNDIMEEALEATQNISE